MIFLKWVEAVMILLGLSAAIYAAHFGRSLGLKPTDPSMVVRRVRPLVAAPPQFPSDLSCPTFFYTEIVGFLNTNAKIGESLICPSPTVTGFGLAFDAKEGEHFHHNRNCARHGKMIKVVGRNASHCRAMTTIQFSSMHSKMQEVVQLLGHATTLVYVVQKIKNSHAFLWHRPDN
ncbi:hypothetical protein niasHT_012384 [Heterodera trifolii]|uniref:Effector protein n=1 Tax=Heterodera trifolii TaxID=157864 RepID=A0ABD2L319_9BILA